MLNKEFINILKKIVKENKNILLQNNNSLASYLADVFMNEHQSERDLLVKIYNTKSLKKLEGASDRGKCGKSLVEVLENDHNISNKRSAEMLELLILLLWNEKVDLKENKIPPSVVTFPIKFSSSNKYGTIRAEVDGIPISSGEKIAKGKTIKFYASPNSGYQVISWNNAPSLSTTYECINIDSPLTIEVVFKKIPPPPPPPGSKLQSFFMFSFLTLLIGSLLGYLFSLLPLSMPLWVKIVSYSILGSVIMVFIIFLYTLNKDRYNAFVVFIFLSLLLLFSWINVLKWLTSNEMLVSKAIKKTYIGTYQNSIPHGTGEIKIRDGRVYYGEFTHGKVTGIGNLTFKNGDKYEGTVINALPAGFGEIITLDEEKYTGNWIKGLRHGTGSQRWSTDNIYSGDWIKDNRIGTGTYTFENGDEHSHNEWKYGKEGQMTYKEGVYIGMFKSRDRHGNGKMFYNDGVYEGAWKNDKKHGIGTYLWNDGSKYEGNWKKNEMTGKGKMTYLSDEEYFGDFKKGVRHGIGTLRLTDGQILHQGKWKNDVFVK